MARRFVFGALRRVADFGRIPQCVTQSPKPTQSPAVAARLTMCAGIRRQGVTIRADGLRTGHLVEGSMSLISSLSLSARELTPQRGGEDRPQRVTSHLPNLARRARCTSVSCC